ncbi:MAG: HlyD family efflux transporter periplasmic adaptor subunit [Beijerinckiaceae bacterium]|nr:HlyD family efflux transporter periplasmic adaptor subunit [Beijerinckiaceae bacterium]
MRPGRILFWLISAAIATIAAFWLLRPAAIVVEAATVMAGQFVASVTADGRTRVRERYVISAPGAGRIERVRLKPGDRIAKDAPVAVLRAAQPALVDARARAELEERLGAAKAQVEEADTLLARARIVQEKAMADLERTRQLLARGAVSGTALERDLAAAQLAGRDMAAAERRFHATTHLRAQAAAAVRRSVEPGASDMIEITAPVAGVVLRVVVENETVVQAGTAILELGDLADLEIVADALTVDAVRMRAGAPVIIQGWGGPADLRGIVQRVEPGGFTKISALGVEEQRTNIIINLVSSVEMQEALGDNYRVEVKIQIAEQDRAILVPAGALFRRASGWYVFTIVDGRARLRRVELSGRSGEVAAIGSGLEPGMPVIVFPPSQLEEGMEVRLK